MNDGEMLDRGWLIRARLGDLGVRGGFFARREIKDLPEALELDETIKAAAVGLMGRGSWLVLCTDRRLLFLNKGPLWGLKQIEIPLEQVSSVAHRTGLMYGQVKIQGAGETVVKRIRKDAAPGFARAVQTSRSEQLANRQQERPAVVPRWGARRPSPASAAPSQAARQASSDRRRGRRAHQPGPVGWPRVLDTRPEDHRSSLARTSQPSRACRRGRPSSSARLRGCPSARRRAVTAEVLVRQTAARERPRPPAGRRGRCGARRGGRRRR